MEDKIKFFTKLKKTDPALFKKSLKGLNSEDLRAAKIVVKRSKDKGVSVSENDSEDEEEEVSSKKKKKHLNESSSDKESSEECDEEEAVSSDEETAYNKLAPDSDEEGSSTDGESTGSHENFDEDLQADFSDEDPMVRCMPGCDVFKSYFKLRNGELCVFLLS